MDAPTSRAEEYIYSRGREASGLLARVDSSGTKYYHQDHLSNRLVTDSSGSTSAQMGTFPFGESWYNASGDKLLFTTYERDAESGNDYAMARYHVNRLARFSSPDPLAGSIANPQSLNRYAYAGNMPVSATDPSGMRSCESENRGTSGRIEADGHGEPLVDSDSDSSAAPGPPPPCLDLGDFLGTDPGAPPIT